MIRKVKVMDNPEINQEVQATEVIKAAIPWGWLRAIVLFVVWLFAYVVVSNVTLVLIAIIQGINPMSLMADEAGIFQTIGVGWMVLVEFLGLGTTLLLVWIFRRFIDRKSFISLGFQFKSYRNDLFAGMGWGVVLMAIGFATLWISGMLTITAIQFDPANIILYLILFIIVAFNEEILIRGYMLLNLMDSANKYLALIISSLLFSLMHFFNANISVVPAINLFIAGILLGIYFIHKGNLWFPIGMHFTWNFFQGPIFGFEVSGMKTSFIISQSLNGNELLTGGEFGFEGSLIASVAMIILIIVIHLKHRKV